MTTHQEKIQFLLETQAEIAMLPLYFAPDSLPDSPELSVEARDKRITEDNIDAAKDLPIYTTNFIGSKQDLTDWIWKNTPDGVKSVLDAFSGSAVVGYMYKQKGLRVICNDRLKYCWHLARAIVENQKVTLSEDDLEALLKENPKAGSFVYDTFKGKFFQTGVHALIDNIRANIDALAGFKKDLALFALGKTCISANASFGHFQSSQNQGFKNHINDTPKEFLERFKKNVERINALVFDNEQENKAYRKDILEIFDEVKVDLAYFDPPYATQFSVTNYETSYHFIEGLMTYWKGLEIDESSKVKKFKTDHQTVTQSNAEEFFDNIFEKATGIKYLIISYRDKAYPNERKMKELIEKHGKSSRMKSHDHTYSLGGTNRQGEASHGKEHIFICEPGSKKSNADVEDDMVMESDPLITAVDVFCQPSLIAESNFEGIEENISAEAAKDTSQFIANFMGSKRKLMSWIWAHTPENVETVLDLFSGGANVGYFYKKKGLRVISNDLLKYPYHIARAVVENSSVTLSDEDIENLLSANKETGDFIVKTFHGYYYTKQILEFLDNTYANIQKLSGYKKDISLFALGATCKAKTSFGEFHRSKKALTRPLHEYKALDKHKGSQLGNIPLSDFKESFIRYIKHANSLVFDNGKECKAFNKEAIALLSEVKADVVYADPPYVTEFNFNDYEADNHFQMYIVLLGHKNYADDRI
ncbi:MAG: DNA adenine methylase, partial [FCB group bacterium]|nr:DNA adenine methylase [FCB group bacterium]